MLADNRCVLNFLTGGQCFGYDNVVVTGPGGQRSHVERRINETEAAVVRRIFELSAAGYGYSRITKTLNAEKAPSPTPQQGRPVAWSPTSVKSVLERPAYRGEIVWNRTKKRDQWGQRRHIERAAGDWLKRSAPELRIVADDLWRAVHGRLTEVRKKLDVTAGGRFGGRRARDVDSKYLLSGHARCSTCGGSLGKVRQRTEGERTTHVYGCLSYNKRGPHVCGNKLVVQMERTDAAVLSAMVGQVLRPAVVDAVVEGVLEALRPANHEREAKRLRTDLRAVEAELERLAAAVAQGGPLTTLLRGIQERQTGREEMMQRLARLEAAQAPIDSGAIERKIRAKLAEWQILLTGDIASARQFMREALTAPLAFEPDGKQYKFSGEVAVGRAISGVAGLSHFVASPGGLHTYGSSRTRRCEHRLNWTAASRSTARARSTCRY